MHPRRSLFALVPLALLIAAGCGGKGPKAFGQVSGAVLDIDGNPVRGARVFLSGTNSRETTSNAFGSYLLDRVGIGQSVTVKAERTQNGARYVGSNVATVFEGERAASVNVALYPASQLGTISGTTFDRRGNRLSGVRVFARPRGAGILSSAVAVSDNDGNFRLSDLLANQNYDLVSNALGYGDDIDAFQLAPGENREIVLTLGDATNSGFAAPTGVVATAYTSPREISRDAAARNAAEGLKRELDPKRAARRATGRDTASGDPIEVELVWTTPGGSPLGFGVYRGADSASLADVGFLRDPLAEIYTDSDRTLVEGRTYAYALTTLSTGYPDAAGSESSFSNLSTVTTLGSQDGGVVSFGGGGVRFDWVPALGATRTAVFVFDEYPGIGVTSRWNTFDRAATGSSQIYDGPALSRGRTYYYLLLGLNDDGSARAISRVGSFVAP